MKGLGGVVMIASALAMVNGVFLLGVLVLAVEVKLVAICLFLPKRRSLN